MSNADERQNAKDAMIKRIVDLIDALPPMPATAEQLRAAAADPAADFIMLVPLIEKDPGLCADLLHFANSPAYGVRHKVETVAEAVLYFGMQNLMDFILTSYTNRIIRESFRELRHLDDYFTHSEQVSSACYILAQLAGLSRHDQEMCKVGGLLHNIGKLVLGLASRNHGTRLLGVRWQQRQDMIPKEDEWFGLNHCEVGATLCRKWQIPDRLIEGIRLHHNPLAEGKVNLLGAYIYLSELLVIDDLPMEIINIQFQPEVLADLQLSIHKLHDARARYKSITRIRRATEAAANP